MSDEQTLTEWQKAQLCRIVGMGSDRLTACNYVGASPAQLQAEMDRDEAFAREVVRAEAQVELQHLGNVYKAAQSEKNWRTSVWWLERRAQQRSGAEGTALTTDHVAELVEELARIIVDEVRDVDLQRRLVARLVQIVERDGREDGPRDEPSDVPAIESTVDGAPKSLAAPDV